MGSVKATVVCPSLPHRFPSPRATRCGKIDRAEVLAKLVLDRAAVGPGYRMSDGAALLDREHGFFEIGFRIGDIAHVRGGDAVDAAHVLQCSILVDDEH